MAKLSLAGQELVRNQLSTLADVERSAHALRDGIAGDSSWSDSSDWRVKLGISAALGRQGAREAPCVPQVRSLLFHKDLEIKRLAAKTLSDADEVAIPAALQNAQEVIDHASMPVFAEGRRRRASACGVEKKDPQALQANFQAYMIHQGLVLDWAFESDQKRGDGTKASVPSLDLTRCRSVIGDRNEKGEVDTSQRITALLASKDWRVRQGTLEAVARQGTAVAEAHSSDVANMLLDVHPAVRRAAATTLKGMGSVAAPFVAEVWRKAEEAKQGECGSLLKHFACADPHLLAMFKRDAAEAADVISADVSLRQGPPIGQRARQRRMSTRRPSLLQQSESVSTHRRKSLPHGGAAGQSLPSRAGAEMFPSSMAEMSARSNVEAYRGPDLSAGSAFTEVSAVIQLDSALHSLVTRGSGRVEASTIECAMATLVCNKNETVRAAVIEALIDQGRQPAGALGEPAQRRRPVPQVEQKIIRSTTGHGLSAAQLVALLEGSQGHTRHSALVSLGHLQVDQVLPFAKSISARLNDSETQVCIAAAETLGVLGEQAVAEADAVVPKLYDEKSAVRQAAVRALGCMKAKTKAYEISQLLRDPDASVRRDAALALGSLGPSVAAAPAAELLRSSDSLARVAAKRALVAAVEAEVATVEKDAERSHLVTEGVKHRAASELQAAHAMDLMRPHLLPVLADSSAEVRRDAADIIERLGGTKDSAEMLANCQAALLGDLDETVRENAARMLGNIAGAVHPDRVATLSNSLRDDCELVRKAAAESLSRLGHKHDLASSSCATELLKHPLQSVRRAASTSLSARVETSSHSSARHLAMLTDASPSARSHAVKALGDLCAALGDAADASHISAIAALHIDRHWCVRLAVVEALGQCGRKATSTHSAIRLLTTDVDWRVQRAAQIVSDSFSLPALHASTASSTMRTTQAWDDPVTKETQEAALAKKEEAARAAEAAIQERRDRTQSEEQRAAEEKAHAAEQREKEEAARKIQAIHRAQTQKMKSADNESTVKHKVHRSEDEAATRIQSIRRAGVARREVKEKKERESRRSRGNEEQNNVSSAESHALENAATNVQKHFRGFKTRQAAKAAQFGRGGSDSTTRCACGSVFMLDARFCRKCGAPRPEASDRTDAEASSHHRHHHHHGHHHSRSQRRKSAE